MFQIRTEDYRKNYYKYMDFLPFDALVIVPFKIVMPAVYAEWYSRTPQSTAKIGINWIEYLTTDQKVSGLNPDGVT